jgi:hypothetical protein
MAVVAGVDFGTLSVRVSIVDSERGMLASAVSEYPLHRKREDPEYATQSHEDHMRALASATRKAIKQAGISGDQIEAIALDTTGSSVIPIGKIFNRSVNTICGAITVPKAKPKRSLPRRSTKNLKQLSGAAACTPRNGDSPSCCTGCGTILNGVKTSLLRSSIAIWLPPLFAA